MEVQASPAHKCKLFIKKQHCFCSRILLTLSHIHGQTEASMQEGANLQEKQSTSVESQIHRRPTAETNTGQRSASSAAFVSPQHSNASCFVLRSRRQIEATCPQSSLHSNTAERFPPRQTVKWNCFLSILNKFNTE